MCVCVSFRMTETGGGALLMYILIFALQTNPSLSPTHHRRTTCSKSKRTGADVFGFVSVAASRCPIPQSFWIRKSEQIDLSKRHT